MARTFADEIVETSSTTGTGTYSLGGAKGTYRTFREGYADGNATTYYGVRNASKTKWELHRNATLTYGSPDTLTRNVFLSTNSNAAVSWAAADLPLTVYVPSAADVLEMAITGGAATSRPTLSREAAVWADTTAGWSARVPFKINPAGTEREIGAYEGAQGIYVPSMRRPFTAKGAADYTVTTSDAGWRFSFNTSAATRTVTLPSTVSLDTGFRVDLRATSNAYPLTLAPTGSVAIDGGGSGSSITIRSTKWFSVFWDGSQWRTTAAGAAPSTITDKGTSGYTVTTDDHDSRFSFNTSAAQRTATLPAGSTVGAGFMVWLRASSTAFPLAVAPNGTDAIDGLGNATKYVMRTDWFSMMWDGSQWWSSIGPMVLYRSGSFSGSTNLDMVTNIPATVNSLQVSVETVFGTDNVNLGLRTFGADGAKDTGGSDYSYSVLTYNSGTSSVSAGTSDNAVLAVGIDNSSFGLTVDLAADNIQASTYTKFRANGCYLSQDGSTLQTFDGMAARLEADRITGVNLTPSSGTMTGRYTIKGFE